MYTFCRWNTCISWSGNVLCCHVCSIAWRACGSMISALMMCGRLVVNPGARRDRIGSAVTFLTAMGRGSAVGSEGMCALQNSISLIIVRTQPFVDATQCRYACTRQSYAGNTQRLPSDLWPSGNEPRILPSERRWQVL